MAGVVLGLGTIKARKSLKMSKRGMVLDTVAMPLLGPVSELRQSGSQAAFSGDSEQSAGSDHLDLSLVAAVLVRP